MTWFEVVVALDEDELRTYAIEANEEAEANEIALRALPQPDLSISVLGERPDEFDARFDQVIAQGEA